MSRTVPANLATHIAGRSHTRCSMLRLDLTDGTSLGITDHDRDLAFDLGDGEITYSAATGIFPSDVTLAAGLDADNFELTGPLGDDVTLETVLGGRFNRATARLFQVNWKALEDGSLPILKGYVSEARVEGGQFVFEIRSESDRLNQVVGRVITPYCSADYGDARCGATPLAITGTVDSVTDAMRFTVTFAGTYADDYFNMGTVTFTAGELNGTAPVEIFDWTGAGAITLFVPLADVPVIGDTLTITRGCGKTRVDCMARANIANFRGFPEVPGTDQVLKYPVPSQ